MTLTSLPSSSNKPLRALAPLLAAATLALGSQQALGQSRDQQAEERWYQVELIVFSQDASRDGDEVWRRDIELDYPLNWKELVDPARLMEESQTENLDPNLGEADFALDNPDQARPPEREQQQEQAQPSQQRPEISDGRQLGGIDRLLREQEESIDPAVALRERGFLLLPTEELSLTNEAGRLRRAQNHQVLFHGGWRQSFVENRQEPSLLVFGGELFDEHHELEGSIQLYLRTYLHIETDLWLSEFSPNFGQEREAWPTLPLPPNRPLDPGRMFRIDDAGTGLWHQLNQDRREGRDYEAILAQPYVVENLVLMQQERRMRSGELHYLDHPKLGVLIKLTPYEPPVEDEDQ